jgi:hypothetical protein
MLDEGNDCEAIRRCVHALMGVRDTEKKENRMIKEKVIEMVQNDGLRERILDDLEDRYRSSKSIFFGPIYELYKFEIYAFGDVSLRTLEGLCAFYESRDDRMTVVGLSQTILEQYEKQGRDDLLEEAQQRVDANIQLLREKAAHYQETGEHRYAFNSYRYLLKYDFDNYEYHLGYLFNAIKSGKPEEAYKTILEDKAHRDYVLADETLKNYFYDLSHLVSADDIRPELLH